MDKFQARSLQPLDQEVLETWGGVACRISGSPVPYLRGSGAVASAANGGEMSGKGWGWSMERRGNLL